MTQREVDLLISWVNSYGQEWTFKNRRNALFNSLEFLSNEVKRLKAGNFTEEEFQNLCHNASEENKCEFFEGCHEYQRKLFGVSDRDELIKRCRAEKNLQESMLFSLIPN